MRSLLSFFFQERPSTEIERPSFKTVKLLRAAMIQAYSDELALPRNEYVASKMLEDLKRSLEEIDAYISKETV